MSVTAEERRYLVMDAKQLHAAGVPLIPLRGKRPLLKWRQFMHPSIKVPTYPFAQVMGTPGSDGIGVVTGWQSGLMVLDFDSDPYPDNTDSYIDTPSGGRHYFYTYKPEHNHGLNVPNYLGATVDIPHIVRLYADPVINSTAMPINAMPKEHVATHDDDTWKSPEKEPHMEDIKECEFIKWFRAKRASSSWDGRYPLARAYIASVHRLQDADTDLGPGYRHTSSILSDPPPKPITCQTIGRLGYPCPFLDSCGECKKESGVRTPYGLAIKRQKV